MEYLNNNYNNCSFILDRWFMSEIVYSKIFKRPCYVRQTAIEHELIKYNTLFVLLYINKDELNRRLTNNKDRYVHSLDTALKIQDEFLKRYKKSILNKICIDVSYSSIGEQTDLIVNKLKQKCWYKGETE